jgi:hypothetical protein
VGCGQTAGFVNEPRRFHSTCTQRLLRFPRSANRFGKVSGKPLATLSLRLRPAECSSRPNNYGHHSVTCDARVTQIALSSILDAVDAASATRAEARVT